MSKILSKHPLIAEAMEGVRPRVIRSLPRALSRLRRTGTLRPENPQPPRSAVEHYHRLVFHHVSKVVSDFDALEHICAMVRRLPPRRTLKRWDVSVDKWFEYQNRLYLVMLDGAIDRCLIAVNAVLRLGLAPRDCKDQVLQRHSRIAGTKVEVAIKQLLKESQASREERNTDVHRKDLPPLCERIAWDEYDLLPVLALIEREDGDPELSEALKKGFRCAGQLLSSRMQNVRTRLKNRVWRLFDVLLPIAKRQIAACSHLRRVASPKSV